jgi:hypothetical protein
MPFLESCVSGVMAVGLSTSGVIGLDHAAPTIFISGPTHGSAVSKNYTHVHGLQRCSRCREEKLLSEFHKKGNRTDSRCKTCVSHIKKLDRKKRLQAKKKRAFSVVEMMLTGKPSSSDIESLLRLINSVEIIDVSG